MSKGNAEQPTAQAPRGHSSPNHVEVSGDGRQGAPQSPGTPRPQSPGTPGPWDQSMGNGPQGRTPTGTTSNSPTAKAQGQEPTSPNGQSKDPRGEERATAPAAAAARTGSAGESSSPQSPGTATRPQLNAGRPGGAPSPGPTQQKQPPVQSAQQKQPPPAQPRPQPQAGGQAASASAPTQPRTQSSPTPGTPQAQQASGAVPVWDPPPLPAPKESVWARLGFGRKADHPEESPTASPVQQQPPVPTTQPVQQRPAPGNQPGTQAGPGAAVAAGLTAAAATQAAPQVAPQAPAGQPGMPQGPVRPGETTSRTPAVPGDASPVAPPSGPQARMPSGPVNPAARMPAAPVHPSAPGAVPVPGQELKDLPTVKNPPLPADSDVGGAEAHHAAKPKVGVARRTRKARLRLSRLDPWSVMKTSFLFSIAAGIMLVAAVYSVWAVLSTSQLFESINEIVRSVVSTPGDTTPFRIQEYINTQKVMGVTALIACVDVVIFTALATLGSFLYNLAATMLGGLEITLAED